MSRKLHRLLLAVTAVLPALPQTIPPEKMARLRGVMEAIYRMQYEQAEKLSQRLIADSPAR